MLEISIIEWYQSHVLLVIGTVFLKNRITVIRKKARARSLEILEVAKHRYVLLFVL